MEDQDGRVLDHEADTREHVAVDPHKVETRENPRVRGVRDLRELAAGIAEVIGVDDEARDEVEEEITRRLLAVTGEEGAETPQLPLLPGEDKFETTRAARTRPSGSTLETVEIGEAYEQMKTELSELIETIAGEMEFGEVRKLTPRHKLAGDLVKTLVDSGWLAKAPIKGLNEVTSRVFSLIGELEVDDEWEAEVYDPEVAWRLYAHLHLKGGNGGPSWVEKSRYYREFFAKYPGEKEAVLRAGRYGVVMPIERIDWEGEDMTEVLEEKLQKVLGEGMPWQRKNGEKVYDYQLGQEGVRALDLRQERWWEGVGNIRGQVVVLYKEGEMGFSEHEKEAVVVLMSQNKQVVTVHHDTEIGDWMHAHNNHENIDAKPVRYELTRLARELGSGRVSLLGYGPLQQLMDEGARRTNLGAEKGSFVESPKVFEGEVVEHMKSLYGKLKNRVEGMEYEGEQLKLSWATFVQLLMLEAGGVDGQEIRGGVLRFSCDPEEMLDAFACNLVVSDVFRGVELGDAGAVADAVRLYEQRKSNVKEVIGKTAKQVPQANLRQWLAEMTDWRFVEGARYLAGNELVTVMYDGDRLASDDEGLELSGIPGPAVPYRLMDMGNAVYLVMDENRDLVKMIVCNKQRDFGAAEAA